MQGWGDVLVGYVTSTSGNLTQLYPDNCTVGTGATTRGTWKRQPCEGVLTNLQVETDGTNGGEIEIWDINGEDVGADVNTAAVISNTQLLAAIALGRARIIYSQKFSGSSGARLAIAHGVPFVHGLAARFIASAGSIELDITADGGFRKVSICG